MVRQLLCRLWFATFLALFGSVCPAQSASLDLRDGDRVVLVGGTFIERMQQYGYLETLLTVAHPDKRLRFRNLGWSGDTVWGESRALFGSQADGYARLIKDVKQTKPTVLVICYGANEAHAGEAGLPQFVDGLNQLLDDLSDTRARLVLLSPYARQAGPPGVSAPDAYNAQLKLYCSAIEQTAAKRNAEYVSLFDLLDALPKPTGASRIRSLTDNGLHLTDAGYRQAAFEIAKRLGIPPQLDFAADNDPLIQLRAAIHLKNELYFHRYRPQNETYLFLFRKHEQGNNAVEIPQFDPLIAEQEKLIFELNGQVSH